MNEHPIDQELKARLDEIKPVPPRDLQAGMRGRANFLNEALKIEEAVSARRFFRHMRWIPMEKEKLVMNTLISVIVIAGLLFGGGATVNAAQDELPGQPLYALKTASEDLSLQFQSGPEQKVTRLMQLAQTRVQEMRRLVEKGATPPDQLRTRLEQHIQQALQTCTRLDDETMDRTLLQIRDQLRDQDREVERLQLHASPDAFPVLDRTRQMLQTRLRLVDEGLLNHEQFRNAARNGFDFEQTVTPAVPAGTQVQNQTQEQNQNQNQLGQPTSAPGGPNPDSGGPNTDPGGPNYNATPKPKGSQNGSGTGTGSGSGSGSGSTTPGGNGPGGSHP